MCSIYEDRFNNLLLGGNEGLFVFHREKEEFIRIDDDIRGKSRLPNLEIQEIREDAFGNHAAAQKFIYKAKEHNPQLRPAKIAGMLLAQFDKEKGRREYQALEKLWVESET